LALDEGSFVEAGMKPHEMHINLLSADSPISPANAFAASRTFAQGQ
jgi:hypothetical protein